MKSNRPQPADCIAPLVINGLRGRKLFMKSTNKKKTKRDILLIYGLHSSLERMFGIAELLSDFGNVTMPDLPGFGGMDSFYKLGKIPDLDNMADYLATFIKLTYKKQPITIGAMSYGFIIVTKMLQKYPVLTTQVELLVSIAGFSSAEDFKLSKKALFIMRNGSSIFKYRLPAAFVKYIILRGPLIAASYYLISDRHAKMKDADNEERKRRIKFEIHLWQCNEVRTYMLSSNISLTANLTNNKVNLPLIHLAVDGDQYFNGNTVRINLSKIYKSLKIIKANMKNHAPTVIADADSVRGLFPKEIQKILNERRNKQNAILNP